MANVQHKYQPFLVVLLIVAFLTGNSCAKLPATGQTQIPPVVPQLTSDFTLKYAGVLTENQTAIAKEAILQATLDGDRIAIKEGFLTKVQADQQEAQTRESLKHDKPPVKFSVVLSSRNGKLLYRTNEVIPRVYLWDGKNSYYYNSNDQWLEVKSGFGFKSLVQIPCPGVGLPGIPFIKLAAQGVDKLQLRGDVFTGRIEPFGPMYLPGVLRFERGADGTLHLVGGDTIDSGSLYGRYEFSGQVTIGNLPVARHMRYSQINRSIPHPPGTDPIAGSTTDYTLSEFSDKALPEDQFNPVTYMPKTNHSQSDTSGAVVSWTASNDTITFRHDPDQNLEQEYLDQVKMEKSTAEIEHTRDYKRTGIAGPILMVLLVACFVAWLLRRRVAATR